MDEENDLLQSVAEVFDKSDEQQAECKKGLLFLERMAVAGYEEPARMIIDFLRPVDTMEGAWILTMAVVLGLGNAFRLLIKAGANLELQNVEGYSPFHIAVKENRLGLVRTLLDSALVSPDEPTYWSCTPLILAAENGSSDCLRILLESGASVNASSNMNETALHGSARMGDSVCLQLLLAQEGVELDRVSLYDVTPLMEAVQGDHFECVQLLLKAGADVKEKNSEAVHSAVFRNRVDILRLLVDAGAPLEGLYDAQNLTICMTPVSIAASTHHAKCLKLLIALGANVNATMQDGSTPLHLAVEPDGVRWNILAPLSKEAQGDDFQSRQADCVRALLAAGADVNACNENLQTPVHICATYGASWCMRILLKAGANTSSVCRKGKTALHYAAKCGQLYELTLLLGAGAPVNHKDLKGKTALHVAAKFVSLREFKDRYDGYKILMEAGADREAINCKNQTPLNILFKSAENVSNGEKSKKKKGMIRECVKLWISNCRS